MNDATKVRNWNVDDQLNRDWLKLLLRLRGEKEGQFRRIEGRTVFLGGPSSGGGNASAESVGIYINQKLDQAEYDNIRSQVKEWEGTRGSAAEEGIKTLNRTGLGVVIRDGEEIKAVSGAKVSSGALLLDYLGTKEPGYGRKSMEALAEIAIKKRMGLRWVCTPQSRAFYNHIGFKGYEQNGVFNIPLQAVKEWLSKQ